MQTFTPAPAIFSGRLSVLCGALAGAASLFAAPIAQQAFVKPAQVGLTQGDDYFGYAVAVSGDIAVVGAYRESSSTTGVNSIPNEGTTEAGAAYVFVRRGAIWTQEAYLKASNAEGGDLFGFSVAVSGNTVVVGAMQEDSSTTGVNSTPNNNASFSGAAYVFVRNGTTWTQQAYLKASNTGGDDGFGWSVAISGDTVVVGAVKEDSSSTGVESAPNEGAFNAGAAYVFARSGTTWTQQAYLKPAAVGTSQAGDEFGTSVAVSGNTVIVGARGEDSGTSGVNSTPNESAPVAGAAYVFVRTGSAWSQQAYLKAGNPGGNDYFGTAVAISGDTAIVGAPYEASSSTGVNSTPNEGAPTSGAAYVFLRSGGTWAQQAYLKASNTGAGDSFGTSVSLSENQAIVGAYYESSSSTGVNSTPNEGASEAGAAYVFARGGATWTQRAYLKPAAIGSSQVGDNFGISVAVSGNTEIVGAWQEDSDTLGVNNSPNEGGARSGAAYIFTVPPTANGIAPAGGSTAGGTNVTITGEDFAGPMTVTIGRAPATNATVVNPTTLTATTSASLPGVADVVVSTLEGSVTLPGAFTYVAPALVASVNPPGGPTAGGTSIQIHGGPFTGATGVIIAGTPVTSFTVQSDTKIIATTAPHGMTLPAGVSVVKPFATGTGPATFTYVNLSNTVDTDGDGLNDAAERQLAGLGFDHTVAQPSLVAAFTFGNGLFTPAQVQALNVGVPLIARNPTTGQVKLTIGVKKATNLTNFLPFPLTSGVTVVNGAGELEFTFPAPEDAAFFRLEAD